jgi:hypothetical protein
MTHAPRTRPRATRRNAAPPFICAAIVATAPDAPQSLVGGWALHEGTTERPLRHGRLVSAAWSPLSLMTAPDQDRGVAERQALHLRTVHRALEALASELARHPRAGTPLLVVDHPHLFALCAGLRRRVRVPLDATLRAIRALLRVTGARVRNVTSEPLRQLYLLAQYGIPPVGPADYHRLVAWCAAWPRQRAAFAAANIPAWLLQGGDTALEVLWDWLRFEAPAPCGCGHWSPHPADLAPWPPGPGEAARRSVLAGVPAADLLPTACWLREWATTLRSIVRTLAQRARLLGDADLPDGWRYWELPAWRRDMHFPVRASQPWDFLVPACLATLAEGTPGADLSGDFAAFTLRD